MIRPDSFLCEPALFPPLFVAEVLSALVGFVTFILYLWPGRYYPTDKLVDLPARALTILQYTDILSSAKASEVPDS